MNGLLTTEQLLEQHPDVFEGVGVSDTNGLAITPARALESYPDASDIYHHIAKFGFPKANVPTRLLNINGRAVQDAMEKYLSASDYYTSGQFAKTAMGTELDLYYEREEGWKQELEQYRNRKAFEFGTFVHEAILEPTKWGRVTVMPKEYDGQKMSKTSSDGCAVMLKWWVDTMADAYPTNKEMSDVFKRIEKESGHDVLGDLKFREKQAVLNACEMHSGISVVSESDYIKIQIIKKRWNMYAGGVWKSLIKHAKREISFYADDYRGLPQRVRPDALLLKENVGVDCILSVKTTSKPNLRLFMSQVASLGYHIKEAAYQEVISHVSGRDFATTLWVVIQTVEPYGIGIVRMQPDDIELSKYLYHAAIDTALRCSEAQSYRGYDMFSEENHLGIIDMSLPKWAKMLPDQVDTQ